MASYTHPGLPFGGRAVIDHRPPEGVRRPVSQVMCLFRTLPLTCQFPSISDLPREGSWIEEGVWMAGSMVTTWNKKVGVCFVAGSTDLLSIPFKKKKMRLRRRITWESQGMIQPFLWRTPQVLKSVGLPLSSWQSLARPWLSQWLGFTLVFKAQFKSHLFCDTFSKPPGKNFPLLPLYSHNTPHFYCLEGENWGQSQHAEEGEKKRQKAPESLMMFVTKSTQGPFISRCLIYSELRLLWFKTQSILTDLSSKLVWFKYSSCSCVATYI